MRSQPPRRLPLALLILALAACDDDPSGPDEGALTREEVGGVYTVCTLVFNATGLRPVDVRAAVTEPGHTAELRVSLLRDAFDFEYTSKGDVVRELVQGAYERGSASITLNFPDEANVASILLPDPLRLEFDERVLTATPSAAYRVPREDYASLAGLTADETRNLQAQIEGTLSARFAIGACR